MLSGYWHKKLQLPIQVLPFCKMRSKLVYLLRIPGIFNTFLDLEYTNSNTSTFPYLLRSVNLHTIKFWKFNLKDMFQTLEDLFKLRND